MSDMTEYTNSITGGEVGERMFWLLDMLYEPQEETTLVEEGVDMKLVQEAIDKGYAQHDDGFYETTLKADKWFGG